MNFFESFIFLGVVLHFLWLSLSPYAVEMKTSKLYDNMKRLSALPRFSLKICLFQGSKQREKEKRCDEREGKEKGIHAKQGRFYSAKKRQVEK